MKLPVLVFSAMIAATGAAIDWDGKNLEVLKMFGQRRIEESTPGRVDGTKAYHVAGVTVDRSRTPNILYVIDAGNNRILGFRGMASATPERVFGQPDLFSSATNGDDYRGFRGPTNADQLALMHFPDGTNTAEQWMFSTLDVDRGGNLYVVDRYNNRVLIYFDPFGPRVNGRGDTRADRVLGQPDFVSNQVNRGYGDSFRHNSSLATYSDWDYVSSRGVTVDDNLDVWVADTFNHRVLRFRNGKTAADLVLGQPNFNTAFEWEELTTAPLNRMGTPTLARIRPDTGELYVIDEHRQGFRARILVFTPPFSNGMSANRIIVPLQTLAGDFAAGYQFAHATGLHFNRFKTADPIDPSNPTGPKYRDGTIWVHDSSRTLLLSDSGQILLAIGARDLVSRGGRFDHYDQAGVPPEANYSVIWAGGSMGFDDQNTIILGDAAFHKVGRFQLPYRTQPGQTIMPDIGGKFLGQRPNRIGPQNGYFEFGFLRIGSQLALRDWRRFMVHDNYLSKPIGAAANVIVGQPSGFASDQPNDIMGWSQHPIDRWNRMWCTGQHGKLMTWQAPFTASSAPIRTQIPLYWADQPTVQVDYDCWSGLTIDRPRDRLWVLDRKNHRILRCRIPTHPLGKVLVDAVLCQTSKGASAPNAGLGGPNAMGIADAMILKLDPVGNLFVVDNTYELHHNGRVIAFSAASLSGISTMFPNLSASYLYVRKTFTSDISPASLLNDPGPHSPVNIAFNSRGEMVLANDGYSQWSPELRPRRQLFLYRSPLTKNTPDEIIELPLGAPAEIEFDAQGNLIVQDGTWLKFWVINFDRDPEWLIPFPKE